MTSPPRRKATTPLRRVIPGACLCGGAFVLEQHTIATAADARAFVRGKGTTLPALVDEDLPLRLDAYRCEANCGMAYSGCERLISAAGDLVFVYGKPTVRVW